MADQPKKENKHIVVEGVAYQTVGNSITNKYVEINGKRVYVFGHKAGAEITAAEAKKAAVDPVPTPKDETPADKPAEA